MFNAGQTLAESGEDARQGEDHITIGGQTEDEDQAGDNGKGSNATNKGNGQGPGESAESEGESDSNAAALAQKKLEEQQNAQQKGNFLINSEREANIVQQNEFGQNRTAE